MTNPSKYRLSYSEKLFIKFGPPVIALLVKVLCRSCRLVALRNAQVYPETLKKYGGCIYAVFHQRMFYFIDFLSPRPITVMISQSKDGEYVNALARHFGYQSVRGSSTRNGRSALRQLIKAVKQDGREGAMLVDGPTGPPRKIKMGAIKIARETGQPIIPLTYASRNKFVFSSWDRYLIPMPFSKIAIIYGEPVVVPADADREECERIRQHLEDQMNRLTDQCDTWWGGVPVGKPGFDLPNC